MRISTLMYLCGAVLFSTPVVRASTVTYDFTVVAISGPLTGDTESGSFSFDSSLLSAEPGAVNPGPVLTGLNFVWGGIDYNLLNANSAGYVVSPTQTLQQIVIGNNCGTYSCGVQEGIEGWAINVFPAGGSSFTYAISGDNSSTYVGEVTSVTAVPLSATAWLLLSGLSGLGAVARRRAAQG